MQGEGKMVVRRMGEEERDGKNVERNTFIYSHYNSKSVLAKISTPYPVVQVILRFVLDQKILNACRL